MDQQPQYSAEPCGERRTEHAETQRIDEHIVKDNVGQRGNRHGGHGEVRVAVISHKGGHDIIQDKCGGK